MLAASQREQELKFELQVPLGGAAPTAVSSFNYHQDHFAERYGLVLADGSTAHTACLGFGEERIVLALLYTHGSSIPRSGRRRSVVLCGTHDRERVEPRLLRWSPRTFRAAAGEIAASARSLYLTIGTDRVFAVLDLPEEAARTRTGVVIVPPFGWDELCAHRSMRRWARTLATNGRATLRIDLPGTGDSTGSPRDPHRVATWTTAVSQSADWLRTQECDRIVAIGVGLGGMLALRAVCDGASIDDLVLWAVPARGSSLLRELHAFAQMAGGTPDAAPARSASAEDGALEVSGFVLTAETVAELGALDLTTAAIPDAARRRVLLLGRDSLAPDRRLRSHLERSGVALTVADGPGYGEMLTHPQRAETPHEVIARSLAWLEAAPLATAPTGCGGVQLAASLPRAPCTPRCPPAQRGSPKRRSSSSATVRCSPASSPRRWHRIPQPRRSRPCS